MRYSKGIKLPTAYFTVTGRGAFPLDMLRYDCAWPASSEDADKMFTYASEVPRNKRSVRLGCANGGGCPTIARWASFGWSVGDETRGEIG